MIKVYLVLSDTNFGGAGRVNLIFAKACDKSKFDITVILPKNSVLKEKFEALGTRVKEINHGADKSFDIYAVAELYKIFRRERPDIVHTHANMSARIAARLAKCGKIVVTRHSVFPVSKHFPRRISGVLNNATADRYIAVSESAKENLIKIGADSNRIDVVLNGTNPLKEISTEDAKNKMGYGKRFVVSIVGRLEDVKGHKYFIKAAEIMKNTNALFVIAGTGSLEETLKNAAGDNVVFTGYLNDVETLINATDVIVNCSYGTEATSMAIIEAMSVGKPAVVSSYGGNPYVVDDNVTGYVVPCRNAKALAEKLCLLMCDKSIYSRMAKASKMRYQTLFTAENMAENTQKVYEKCYFGVNNIDFN